MAEPSPVSQAACKQTKEHESEHEQVDHAHGFELEDATRIGVVIVVAALVWFRVWEPFARVSVIGIIGALIGIYRF
jgi:P-type Cu+ transporter